MLFLWATPRSTSTAFEWMMRQRGDFECFHEPFNEAYYYGADRRSSRDGDVADTEGLSYASVWDQLAPAEASGSVFVKDFAYSVVTRGAKGNGHAMRNAKFRYTEWPDGEEYYDPVSYTHLTLPTKLSV